MKEYSVWIDEAEKIVSFHEVDNSELMCNGLYQCSPFHSKTITADELLKGEQHDRKSAN